MTEKKNHPLDRLFAPRGIAVFGGVTGAQIHSSGFAETGSPEGLARQEEVAGDTNIWEGVLRQGHAISVQGLDELMDALVVLKYLKKPGPRIVLRGIRHAVATTSRHPG